MQDIRFRSRIAGGLTKLAACLPEDSRQWVRAMAAEAPHAAGPLEFASWIAGTVVVTARLAARRLLIGDGSRPPAMTATSLYLTAFSGYVLVRLASQLAAGEMHEPWSEAWFPVLLCLCLSLLPAVIALGVWVCDQAARLMAAAFAVFDLAVIVAFTRSFGMSGFRFVKLVADLAILLALFTPRVRDACDWRRPPARSRGPLGLSH